MKQIGKPIRKSRSVTLIEVLVDGAILAIISTTVLFALLGSLHTASLSASVATATQIANEKLELLRNMSYDGLATQEGPIYPQGSILDSETIIRQGGTFSIKTDIRYIDDVYDGIAGGNPNDTNPADYKRITLSVYDQRNTKLAQISTDIASRAAETASSTGVLHITVLDAQGIAVDNSSIIITNSYTDSPLIINTQTDAKGVISIPNLPVSDGYHIVATKGNYSADSTEAISATNPHPTNPDATLLLQQVTNVTLTIDRLSNIEFIANGITSTQLLELRGSKLKGTDPDIPKTVLTQNINPGSTIINNVEYDSYTPIAPSSWYITTCNPLAPFSVSPNSSTSETCNFTTDQGAIRISTITPHVTSATNDVSWDITGANLFFSSITIQTNNGPEIAVSGMTPASDGLSTSGTVDFSALSPGIYNVIIRNSGGKQTTQINGLVIQ